ncbi:hypothetical protein B9T24_16695 [Acinetobacter sp. ANC 4654]|uniref:hypothetical protein n=1 Tax=Acinetobacter sp. ANC 4654 TaxID=1977872 RepID=UPI000A3410B8|nr:hypothetical protein [Acinetobacter sp. ANC 4654]OTG89250.1 hypothetical protein B9T24_16695 [Acinetobacter sp. ANC 4654]
MNYVTLKYLWLKFGEKKIKLFILILVSLIIPSISNASPNKHSEVPSIYGEYYDIARKKLIQSGWQPRQTYTYNTISTEPISIQTIELFKHGFIEVENCAGTGAAPCIFKFQDIYGNNLQVMTQGEYFLDENHYGSVRGVRLLD